MLSSLLTLNSTTIRQIEKEIGELEVELAGNSLTFDKYGKLIELCLKINAKPRAITCVNLGTNYLQNNNNNNNNMLLERKYEFACSLISFWKYERFSKKDTIRINLTNERKQYLLQAQDILQSMIICPDISMRYKISLKLAYVKECLGLLSQSLSILSDLITAEADDGVELAYIIFKAATILKRLGQNSQALEYLEYLQDDPPSTEGITRTHVLALLTLTFEQSGSKYLVILHETYEKLKESYFSDLRAAPNPDVTLPKAIKSFENKHIEISSEIWEILSLQMLERCEIAFSLEVFQQAVYKAPTKAPLMHSLAELYVLQNEKEKAVPYAEKAYQILPQNGDLRNLLLLIDPQKWNEKLRTAPPVVQESSINQEEEERILALTNGTRSRLKKKEEQKVLENEEDEWLFHRKPVKKEEEVDIKAAEKKKEKKDEKKEEKKEKKVKKVKKEKKGETKEVNSNNNNNNNENNENISEEKETITRPKFVAPPYNRPTKPSFELTDEMNKYIQFSLKQNKNIHMYDSNLRSLQEIKSIQSK